MSSLRCEARMCLLGQLTVFQDKFLIITPSHYCTISAANEECKVCFPLLPPPFLPLCSFLPDSHIFFSHPSLSTTELVVGDGRAPAEAIRHWILTLKPPKLAKCPGSWERAENQGVPMKRTERLALTWAPES